MNPVKHLDLVAAFARTKAMIHATRERSRVALRPHVGDDVDDGLDSVRFDCGLPTRCYIPPVLARGIWGDVVDGDL